MQTNDRAAVYSRGEVVRRDGMCSMLMQVSMSWDVDCIGSRQDCSDGAGSD